ncbi:MAG: alpha/beta hydrolase [Vicinamibacterales bacterium]
MFPCRRHQRRLASGLACALMLLAVGGAACGLRPEPLAIDRLKPCTSDEGPTDAYCGTLTVFENRDTRQGRTIDLKIVVLPALGNDAAPDPLFFLAGGPGQGAAKMARQVRDLFGRIQARRDIVLVDQRGTGDSNGLECRSDDDSLASIYESDEAGLERLKTCLAGYDADTRFYTTPIAMDDLDDVRAFLGYEMINIYGGSYGTRAALVYLRQHEARVRAVVLDGVAPTDMRLPLYFARDAQRALDRLLADCAADAPCAARYPNLAERVRALFARLEATPPTMRLTHPRTGVAEVVQVKAELVANMVAGALYSPLLSSLVPELLARAEADDFQGMLATATTGEGAGENMSAGMQLSVICAEDAPLVTEADIARESAGSVFARHLLASRLKACEFWPKGAVPASYYDPVQSNVPVLVLSGDLDPVTPPSWGEAVAAHLPNARHITAPATGHGVVGTGCGLRLIAAFVDKGTTDAVDTSCLASMKRPPFVLGPAGPDPAPGAAPTP